MKPSDRRIIALAEGKFSPLKSKTANGAIVYLRDQVLAVIDSTKAGMTAQRVLGYGGDIPVVRSIDEGLALKPTHLLIGIAPPGGRLPDSWREIIKRTLRTGVHVLSGLHTLLTDDPEFVAIARENNATITDYRRIPPESEIIPKASWTSRKAKVVLTVGTDCNIGKMTTMLQTVKDFERRGLKADFVATGQTGMLIRGRGIAVDSIISDYTSGCIEKEVDQSVAEGYDYIFVEGQGALTHQGYSAVTLGLIHGTMPDAFILCHQPTRLKDDYGVTLPTLKYAIELHEMVLRQFKTAKVVGIAVNSIGLTDEESHAAAKRIEQETGLPAVDTFRFGAAKLADALLNHFRSHVLKQAAS
ncbi:MAG: hypothetical protein A3H45_00825 [Ignavibacteria bacterium RIFCSPLOWO2_02_FULL_55_14]|nr:MAG: hypothetical protein A3C56_08415 [Ignavibacteria bacterium RIFCSPHIGHO2_02_FULL_56_12]OGU72053.1 MAG: hypothetical protein A3H45_00825 [Ignavibacteria bacterium RIFCSPLOWO2_02_FULL_55_14]